MIEPTCSNCVWMSENIIPGIVYVLAKCHNIDSPFYGSTREGDRGCEYWEEK